MTFAELVAQLQNPGDEGVAPTIYDDLTTSYTDDMGTRDAKIEMLNSTIQSHESEISRLKGMNYDLMMASPAQSEGEPSNDTNADDSASGINDLFDK